MRLQYKGHIAGLDVLRGIAISLVLLYHGVDGRLPWTSVHGFSRYFVYATAWGATGVHLFFILSGFLISGILLDSREKPSYWRRFYINRALRILPAYVLMLAVLKLSHTVTWRFVLAAMLYAANMARLFGASTAEYGPLWSLAVEEQFYLLWPLLVRRWSLRTLCWFAVAVVALSPCAFFLVSFSSLQLFGHNVDFYSTLWGNTCWLLAGALVAITVRTGSLHSVNAPKWIRALVAAAFLSLTFFIYLDMRKDLPAWQARAFAPLHRLPVAAAYVALLIFILLRNTSTTSSAAPGPPASTARPIVGSLAGLLARTASFLGYISYGLYLVHGFIFVKLDGYLASGRPSERSLLWILTTAVIYSLIAIAIAFLSRRYIEEPFLRLKPKPVRP